MARVSRRFAVLCAALVMGAPGLAACSDDPPAASPPPSASPSATASSTAPSGPPTLPPEARGTTPEAAEAFVRYYVSLINYATVTLDTRALKRVSQPDCSTCQLIFNISQNMKAAGRSYEGGQWTIAELQPLPAPRGHRQVRALIRVAQLSVLSADGSTERVSGHDTSYVFDLVKRAESWSVARMVGRSR
jgi:hypothetical protein